MKRSRLTRWLLVWVIGLGGTGGGRVAEPQPAAALNWPNWRGPTGQGYANDTRVPLKWSESDNLLWKTELPGFGNSTPIVWGDRIFLTTASNSGRSITKNPRPDERHVICLRASDGKILWKQLAHQGGKPERSHDWNGFASPSCTTDGTHVFAFFGTPGLFCYDFEGNLLWKHRFGIFTTATGWGTAASPLVCEDLVIQNCDNDGSKALPPGSKAGEAAPMALVALEKATGKVVWQTPRNQGRGFSTPLLIPTPAGRLDLILNGPNGVWAYETRTGREVWHCERNGTGGENNTARFGEPMPVFTKDMLYAASGRPGPFQAIRLGGSGDITGSNVVWEVVRKGHRDVASPILWDHLIFAADSKGMLTCHDSRDGKVLYDERIGTRVLASPVAVRGKLLFVLDTGVTLVIEPGPTFKVVGRNQLGEGQELDFAASPAIADGRLYLRSQSHLYCIGEKK